MEGIGREKLIPRQRPDDDTLGADKPQSRPDGKTDSSKALNAATLDNQDQVGKLAGNGIEKFNSKIELAKKIESENLYRALSIVGHTDHLRDGNIYSNKDYSEAMDRIDEKLRALNADERTNHPLLARRKELTSVIGQALEFSNEIQANIK